MTSTTLSSLPLIISPNPTGSSHPLVFGSPLDTPSLYFSLPHPHLSSSSSSSFSPPVLLMAVNSVPGPVPGPNVAPGPGSGPGPAPPSSSGPPPSPAQRLDAIDEQAWLQLGSLAESMGEYDRAMAAYESALRHNNYSINALNSIAELCRSRENFSKVPYYLQ